MGALALLDQDWLVELSAKVTLPARIILIGSGGLLWHAFQRGITEPLPENSERR